MEVFFFKWKSFIHLTNSLSLHLLPHYPSVPMRLLMKHISDLIMISSTAFSAFCIFYPCISLFFIVDRALFPGTVIQFTNSSVPNLLLNPSINYRWSLLHNFSFRASFSSSSNLYIIFLWFPVWKFLVSFTIFISIFSYCKVCWAIYLEPSRTCHYSLLCSPISTDTCLRGHLSLCARWHLSVWQTMHLRSCGDLFLTEALNGTFSWEFLFA